MNSYPYQQEALLLYGGLALAVFLLSVWIVHRWWAPLKITLLSLVAALAFTPAFVIPDKDFVAPAIVHLVIDAAGHTQDGQLASVIQKDLTPILVVWAGLFVLGGLLWGVGRWLFGPSSHHARREVKPTILPASADRLEDRFEERLAAERGLTIPTLEPLLEPEPERFVAERNDPRVTKPKKPVKTQQNAGRRQRLEPGLSDIHSTSASKHAREAHTHKTNRRDRHDR